jgi:hypothetical protein
MFEQGALHSSVIRSGTDDYDHGCFARFLDLPRVDKVEPSKCHTGKQYRNMVGASEEKLGRASCVQPINRNPVSSELIEMRSFQPHSDERGKSDPIIRFRRKRAIIYADTSRDWFDV